MLGGYIQCIHAYVSNIKRKLNLEIVNLRLLRLGTASMLTEPGGPFIQLSRLNITKYANQQSIAKPLFEYIYYHENDARYVSYARVYIIYITYKLLKYIFVVF